MRHVAIAPAGAEVRLARALAAAARQAGLAVGVEHLRARPWASATFVGARHDLALSAPRAPRLGRWIAELPLAELPMRGHLVASLAVERIEDDGHTVRVLLSALTVEQA